MKMKLKKLFSAFTAAVMLTCGMSVPALAASPYNYEFSSGTDYGEELGKPTSTDNPVSPDPLTQNIRRNKDAAYFPPAYGIFSGDIPTEPTSLYHDNSAPYSGYTGNTALGAYGGFASDISGSGGSVSPGTGSDYGGLLPSTSVSVSTHDTDTFSAQPMYYDDGSIGKLEIPELDLKVKVYEGETLENMKKGLGHFEFTSVWDGNVAIAGHNRGVPNAIGGIKDLDDGDRIIYTTKYGSRTYEVFSRKQISDTDYSNFGWSDDNILTMITCVKNTPNMRWCVQAKAR